VGYPGYNQIHVARAISLAPGMRRRVLVIGCNTGKDFGLFKQGGAPLVCGLDVVGKIGRDCQMDGVTYFQASAEQMRFGNRRDEFVLVYWFATMEHVPDIGRAFFEMARDLNHGGFVYSVASPL
jgi:SAM-dependent methyltransferase